MSKIEIKNDIIETKYGNLNKVTPAQYYNTGELESCRIDEKSELNIGGMSISPLYGYPDVRRKDLPSVKFYKSGNIKTISLYEATNIKTSLGDFEAEKLTLYEDGSIRRLFLLDGKLSGYWSEDDEYNLAKIYELNFEFTSFKAKLMSLQFYKSGQLKSLTLWPKEIIKVKVKEDNIKVRIGISLYENGKIESIEPYEETTIKTSIGNIEAYDKNAIGIHGESNSLKFYEDGEIKSLITSASIIEVVNEKGEKKIHSPKEVMLYANSEIKDTITVLIEFYKDYVLIDEKYKYNLEENKFIIRRYGEKVFTLLGNRKFTGN